MAKLLPIKGYSLTDYSLIIVDEEVPFNNIADIYVHQTTHRDRIKHSLANALYFGVLGLFVFTIVDLLLRASGIDQSLSLLATLVFAVIAGLVTYFMTADYYLTLVNNNGRSRHLERLKSPEEAQALCDSVKQSLSQSNLQATAH